MIEALYPAYFKDLLEIAVHLRIRTEKAKGSYPHGLWQIYKDLVKHFRLEPAQIKFFRFEEDPMALEYWFKSNQARLEDHATLVKLTGRKPRPPKKAKVKPQQCGPAMLKRSPQALSRIEKSTFFKSEEWRRMRFRVFEKYGRRCMCCGARPSDGAVMHVDHIKPIHAYPELRLDFDNLQVLCADCNYGKSAFSTMDFRPKQ